MSVQSAKISVQPNSPVRDTASPRTVRVIRFIRGCPKSTTYWRMAKTIASGVGFSNAYLAELGLLSLKHIWNELVTPHGENTGRTA